MCAHAGMMVSGFHFLFPLYLFGFDCDLFFVSSPYKQGTSRPVHYHVLLDEIGFSADGLQNLINSLSYVYAFFPFVYVLTLNYTT